MGRASFKGTIFPTPSCHTHLPQIGFLIPFKGQLHLSNKNDRNPSRSCDAEMISKCIWEGAEPTLITNARGLTFPDVQTCETRPLRSVG